MLRILLMQPLDILLPGLFVCLFVCLFVYIPMKLWLLELFGHCNFKRERSFAVTFCLPIDILVKALVQYEQCIYRMCKHAEIVACWPFNIILAVIRLLRLSEIDQVYD